MHLLETKCLKMPQFVFIIEAMSFRTAFNANKWKYTPVF